MLPGIQYHQNRHHFVILLIMTRTKIGIAYMKGVGVDFQSKLKLPVEVELGNYDFFKSAPSN